MSSTRHIDTRYIGEASDFVKLHKDDAYECEKGVGGGFVRGIELIVVPECVPVSHIIGKYTHGWTDVV